MYNRYIPNGTSYIRISEPEVEHSAPPPQGGQPHPHRQGRRQPPPKGDPLSALLERLGGGKKNAGLSGIFEALKLDDIDTGDILLILILLFLFRDGDDMELVITLGLILLLGLGDKKKEEESQGQEPLGV